MKRFKNKGRKRVIVDLTEEARSSSLWLRRRVLARSGGAQIREGMAVYVGSAAGEPWHLSAAARTSPVVATSSPRLATT
ncbi:hypothetical protein PR202_ga20765 [Eleusine coracana subsp. coracana]|uniref:Uncharacterized protein n=1 Tax=Eleusine coracana subsp. coracana TaxID=191504 RepID=A0AAV5CZ33_ELECO|nr:hypothetical protein PR202_ga20765 [Eleusine coracana subsp. coracana]